MPDLEDVRISRLQQLAADLAWPGASRTAQFQIGWLLFRSNANIDDGDPCWSAFVRRDLRSMDVDLRKAWLALLDQNDHDYPFSSEPVPGDLCEALGQEEIESRVQHWVDALVETPEPFLSLTGVTLLSFLIRICGTCNSAAADESLYRIALAKWWCAADCEWLAAYLPVIGTRPAHRAFACLEALMMNPVTAAAGDVSRTYHAALNLSLLDVRSTDAPDGYPDRTPEHMRISEFLTACDPANWRGSPSLAGVADPLEPVRRILEQQARNDPARWRRALAERYAWLRRHRASFAPDALLFYRVELRKLIGQASAAV